MKNKASWKIAAMMALTVILAGRIGPGGLSEVIADDGQVQVVIIQQTEGETLQSFEAAAEVLALNSATRQNGLSGVTDIGSMTQISAEEVRTKIEQFYIPDSCIYLDGQERLEGDLDEVIERRNLSALSDPVELRYGVLVENAAVRTYPTWQMLSDGTGEDASDYFQETMFSIGEGVVVLHQTKDGVWSFVQGENDNGWIETENIAFCMREEMQKFTDPQNFLVITEDSVAAGGDDLRMGTRLPLSRLEDGYAAAWIPQATESGNLYQVEQRFNLSAGVHTGYLQLDGQTLVQQAYKLLDTGYARGDANGGMDDASALNAIFRCFGIVLPRQVSRMVYTGASAVDMSRMGAAEKRSLIEAQSAGCLLLSDSHAAMYLGNQNGNPQIFHCVSRYSSDGITITDAYRCVVTSLDIYWEDGQSYLESLRYLIAF